MSKIYCVEITGLLSAGIPLVVADAERHGMTAYRYDYAWHRFTAEFTNPTDCLHFNDFVVENYIFASVGMYHIKRRFGGLQLRVPNSLTVLCKLCGENAKASSAHTHSGGHVCENCWDERLRITE